MARKPAPTKAHPDANSSKPVTANEHPASQLFLSLTIVHSVCFRAGELRKLAERRKRSRGADLTNLNAVLQVAGDRATERLQAGTSLPEAFGEVAGLRELAFQPPQTTESVEYQNQLVSHLIDGGVRFCERAMGQIRDGAGGLDAATRPNANGQPRSIELHTKLQLAHRVFIAVALAVRDPQFPIDERVEEMAALRDWFAGILREMQAVFETRGLDCPLALPTVSPAIQERIDRLEAATAGIERVAGVIESLGARDDDAGVGGTDTDWKDVQRRLLAKRDRGEPYTSLRKLCAELKCSDATIRKAIDESETLEGWQVRSAGPKTAPKATDLGAVVIDNTRQTTEPAPDDVLPDDDVDATMARLINQARPDERAKLNALDDAGRRALVATYQSQNLDDEPSPLKPDKPGERPRNVKQHKRV